jgi:Tfp pilus assembly protein PilW
MKRGFTFIEILIYMGLVSVFLLVLVNMFITLLDTQLETTGSSAVDQDGQYILARLNYDIHRAGTIITPAAAGDTVDTLSLDIGGNTHTYSVSGRKLQLSVSGVTYLLNSHAAETAVFSVTRLGFDAGTPSARISLSLESEDISGTGSAQTRSYQTTVSLR